MNAAHSSNLSLAGFIPDKMDIPYFVLALLIFLPVGLDGKMNILICNHLNPLKAQSLSANLAFFLCLAQVAAESCGAPSLSGGFFLPNTDIYSIGSNLSYGCDEGHKPAVKGWWATSTCQNGEWSPKPQCIGKYD